MNFNAMCSTEIEFTGVTEAQNRLLRCKAQHVVLIASAGAVERWKMNSFISDWKKKCKLTWLSSRISCPTQQDVLEALIKIDEEKPDLIVAIGGGSTIDLAKGISAFHGLKEIRSLKKITEAIESRIYQKQKDGIDIIAVPSTAGTGAEITQWATIWDVDQQNKFSIDAKFLKPKLAMFIPELTITMSDKITLSTGLDALAHAIEAFWAKKTNPMVQNFAGSAIQSIVGGLGKTLNDLDNILYRENMCAASLQAALAFSQTRTTACHSISYPMTLHYKIPHGLAVAITLPVVAELNKGSYKNDNILEDFFADYGNMQNWLDHVSNKIARLRLRNFGLHKSDIKFLVDQAFTVGRMDNNPVTFDKHDIRDILLKVF